MFDKSQMSESFDVPAGCQSLTQLAHLKFITQMPCGWNWPAFSQLLKKLTQFGLNHIDWRGGCGITEFPVLESTRLLSRGIPTLHRCQ